ncbi:MAG TPA: glycosyltransferase [Bryobacteraceae bacterium]|nr:glycosyltransferase [Bryobacteraceae bacterium]
MPEPAQRARVLFFGEAATLSHVARPAVLAASLPAAEYEVRLACHPRFGHLFSAFPFSWTPLDSAASEAVLANARQGRSLFDLATLDRYVQEDLRLIREFSPDVVAGDLRMSLSVSCRLSGVPYINIINAQWSPYCGCAVEFPENPLRDFLPGPAADLLMDLARPLGSALYCFPLNAVRMRYGLPPVSHDIKEQMCDGDYVVHPDVPELVPARALPPRHRYLGPVLWSPQGAPPPWWDAVPRDKPVVYINLGSSGQEGLLATVLRALADLPVFVIAASAARCRIANPPKNAFLADYLPGEQAVRRAQLFVSNGGTMSGQQSLCAGVPVLGLVTHADQLAFAKAVRAAGAGEVLSAARAEAPAIAQTVRSMLSRVSYAQAARRLSAALSRYDAPSRFLALIREIRPGEKRYEARAACNMARA